MRLLEVKLFRKTKDFKAKQKFVEQVQNIRKQADGFKVGQKIDIGGDLYEIGGNAKTGFSLKDADGDTASLRDIFNFQNTPYRVDKSGIPRVDVKTLLERRNALKTEAMKANVPEAQATKLADDYKNAMENNPVAKELNRLSDSNRISEESILRDVRNPVERARMVEGITANLGYQKELEGVLMDWADAVDKDAALKLADSQDFQMFDTVDNLAYTLDQENRINIGKGTPSVPYVQSFVVSSPKGVVPSTTRVLKGPKLSETQLVQVYDKLIARAKAAYAANKISLPTLNRLDLSLSPVWKERAKIAAKYSKVGAVLGGIAGVGWLTYYLLSASLAAGSLEHQKEISGCFVIDSITQTKTKVKLLSCGTYDFGPVMETCATQTYSSAADDAKITECPDNAFNPCVKDSKSRSADPSVPLVPSVCDQYLHKSDTIAPITGVKLIHACKTADNKDIPATDACSPYCKTENFNLPPNWTLQCIDADLNTALVDLVTALGFDPQEIFPPTSTPPPASSAVSMSLVITAGVLGAIFLALLAYYFLK